MLLGYLGGNTRATLNLECRIHSPILWASFISLYQMGWDCGAMHHQGECGSA
jgi:hypothetical protein